MIQRNKQRSFIRFALLAGAMAMTAAACGGDDDDAETTTAGAATTAAAASTAAPDTTDAPADTAAADTTEVADTTKAAPAEQEIDPALVTAAQDEGQVVIYSGIHAGTLDEVMNAAFTEKYGIDVTFVEASTTDVIARLQAEQDSGTTNADVAGVAGRGTITSVEGLLAPIDLPTSVTDRMVEGTYSPGLLAQTWYVNPLGILYNTEIVDTPPKTWEELAAGDHNLVLGDPATSGGNQLLLYSLIQEFGEEFVYDQLASDVSLVVDSTLAVPPVVMSGEAEIGLGLAPQIQAAQLAAGEPSGLQYLDIIPSVESLLAVVANSPHPNAAELYLRWAMTEEAQNLLIGAGAVSVYGDLPFPSVENVNGYDAANVRIYPPADVGAASADIIAKFGAATG